MLAPLCVQQTFLLLCYQTLYSEETVFISVVSSLYINGQTKVTLTIKLSPEYLFIYSKSCFACKFDWILDIINWFLIPVPVSLVQETFENFKAGCHNITD